MTTVEKINYWVELSDYDLETADAMLQTKRYLYVGFMCHQAIEKIFKGVFSKIKEDTPPFVHKLVFIARQGDFYEQFSEEQKGFIDQMEPLNIKTRYPDDKKKLAQKLTYEKCVEILDNTKDLQQWTKENLLSTK
jgi:HEPN domain-containing protein